MGEAGRSGFPLSLLGRSRCDEGVRPEKLRDLGWNHPLQRALSAYLDRRLLPQAGKIEVTSPTLEARITGLFFRDAHRFGTRVSKTDHVDIRPGQ